MWTRCRARTMWTRRANKLLLLATFLSTSTCEEPCTPEFRPNFKDVVELTYNYGSGLVNRMVVKLADGQPFVEMFTDSCRDLSKIKIRVDYRNVEDQDWTQFVGRRGAFKLNRGKLEIRTILPCAQYEVKIVAILEDDTEIDSEILNFGPFYKVLDEDTIKEKLTEESMHDIADTITYSNISSTGFTVSWGDICAQSLNFYLLPGPSFNDYRYPYKTFTNVLQSNTRNSLWISTEPCQKYKVAIESFMTKEPNYEYEESRDHNDEEAEPVTTDPLPDTLITTSMEEGSNVLTWQFTDQTDCVAVINYEIDLISETGEDTNSLQAGNWEDQAAQVDISENTYSPCENYELQMKISYTTQSGNSVEKSVFSRSFRTNHLGEFAPEGTNYLAILEDTVSVTFETCDIEAVVALIDENEDSTVQEFTVTHDDVNVELEEINELMSPCVQYNVVLRGLDGNEFNSEPLEPKKPQGKVAFNQTEYSTDSLRFSVDDIEENSRCQVSDYQVTCHPQEDNQEGKNLLQEFVGKSVDGSFVEVINLAPTTTYICQAMINYIGFEDNTDVIPAEEIDFFTEGITETGDGWRFVETTVQPSTPSIEASDHTKCCTTCQEAAPDTTIYIFNKKYKRCYCRKPLTGVTPVTIQENGRFSNFCYGNTGAVIHEEDADGDWDFDSSFGGVTVQIKYKDPANMWKGGHAHIEVEDLKKLIPAVRSRNVTLDITFDGGVAKMDGIFNLKIEYSLQHTFEEKGIFEFDRKLVGNHSIYAISNKKNGGGNLLRIFPDFKITLLGKIGAARELDLRLTGDVDGQTMEIGFAGNRTQWSQFEGRLKFTNGPKNTGTGDYMIKYQRNANWKVIKFAVNLLGAEMLSLKINMDITSVWDRKTVIVYKGVLFAEQGGQGKITLQVQEVDAHTKRFSIIADTKNEKEVLKYVNTITHNKQVHGGHQELHVTMKANLDLKDSSRVHNFLCKDRNSIHCFHHREADISLTLNLDEPWHMLFLAKVNKDGNNVVDAKIDTKSQNLQTPHIFHLKAPRILPKTFDADVKQVGHTVVGTVKLDNAKVFEVTLSSPDGIGLEVEFAVNNINYNISFMVNGELMDCLDVMVFKNGHNVFAFQFVPINGVKVEFAVNNINYNIFLVNEDKNGDGEKNYSNVKVFKNGHNVFAYEADPINGVKVEFAVNNVNYNISAVNEDKNGDGEEDHIDVKVFKNGHNVFAFEVAGFILGSHGEGEVNIDSIDRGVGVYGESSYSGAPSEGIDNSESESDIGNEAIHGGKWVWSEANNKWEWEETVSASSQGGSNVVETGDSRSTESPWTLLPNGNYIRKSSSWSSWSSSSGDLGGGRGVLEGTGHKSQSSSSSSSSSSRTPSSGSLEGSGGRGSNSSSGSSNIGGYHDGSYFAGGVGTQMGASSGGLGHNNNAIQQVNLGHDGVSGSISGGGGEAGIIFSAHGEGEVNINSVDSGVGVYSESSYSGAASEVIDNSESESDVAYEAIHGGKWVWSEDNNKWEWEETVRATSQGGSNVVETGNSGSTESPWTLLPNGTYIRKSSSWSSWSSSSSNGGGA